MDLAAIINIILGTGINTTVRLVGLFQEWHAAGGNDATPEQMAAVWDRIKIAEDRIDAAHAARHVGDPDA